MRARQRKPRHSWRARLRCLPKSGPSRFKARACLDQHGWALEDTILGLKEKGHRSVFLQPIGFLCDHVEVLYDIDIGFKDFAEKHGMRLWRAESLNDSPLLTAALADVAKSRLGAIAGRQ
jgi:hypothetical protein